MKLILLDGNSLLFKAYFATAYGSPSSIMRTKDGIPTNAIYSLANIANKILSDEKPDYAVVAFDTGKPTLRHAQYKDYKAGRAPTPQELIDQMGPAREMLRLFGFYVHEQEGYEADDIIGTCSMFANSDIKAKIFSSDHDLLQLISDDCCVCLTNKGVSDVKVMTKEVLMEEMGIEPIQIIDLKGLMGDKSDNIPGVPGVGEKTALKLLLEHKTVENVIEAIIPGKLGEKIQANKDSAIMSKQIATINKEVPIPFGLEDTKYNGIEYDSLVDFFTRYEMYSLIKKVSSLASSKQSTTLDNEVEVVYDIDKELLNDESYIDLQINGNNYHSDEIVGLGIRINSKNYFISANALRNSVNVKAYLEDEKYAKSCMDFKSCYVGLNKLGISLKGEKFDLLLSSYLIKSSLDDDPASIFAFLKYKCPFKSEIYVKKTYVLETVAKYSANICENIEQAKPSVLEKLSNDEQTSLFTDIELPLARILGDMEIKGVIVDKELLKEKSNEYKKQLSSLEERIFDIVDEKFNINSPSQLASILFDKLGLPETSKRSTSAQELEFMMFMHPVIELILEYRKYKKLISTYSEGLQNYICDDDRIHTIYNQALTQTGRLSSRDPNLQNITVRTEEGREIRKAFIAKEGYSLIAFDYSQIELRVLASMANVSSLIDAYNNDKDIHANTASKVFGVPMNEVTPNQRRQAKVVNFGIVYGMSEFGLANELKISFGKAREFIQKYFELYPEIKDYYDQEVEFCKTNGYVKTLFNRKRFVPEIHSTNFNERQNAKRIITNTPIQGTAADIMKISMIKVAKAIKDNNLDCSMLMQVHDEIVVEVKDDQVEKCIPIIKNAMEDFDILKVKLVAEYAAGKYWSK